MIESVLRNAIAVQVDGVVDPFLTPNGNIAGQFFTGGDFYDFEIEGNAVRYLKSYRKDSKGKKCPRGYWIPKDRKCRQGVMTPSAEAKTDNIKKTLGAAIAVGLIASSAVAIKERFVPSKEVSREEYKASVEKIEKGIIYKDKEELSIINPKSGKEMYRFKGNETGVAFPVFLPFYNGATVTHNHPPMPGAAHGEPRSTGISFSIPDIATACRLKFGEMRAVSPGFRYSMKPPDKGWDKDFFMKEVMPSYNRNLTKNYLTNFALVSVGLKDYRDAQFGVFHDTWKDVSRETGMKYSLERVPGEKREPRNNAERIAKAVSDGDALIARAIGLSLGAKILHEAKNVAQYNNLLPSDEEIKAKATEVKEEIWRKLARRNNVRRSHN